MINRKAAVIGSGGHWIATRGMRGLKLRLQCQEGTEVQVEQRIHSEEHGELEAHMRVRGPGIHAIEDAIWTRVIVLDQSHVLGFLEAVG